MQILQCLASQAAQFFQFQFFFLKKKRLRRSKRTLAVYFSVSLDFFLQCALQNQTSREMSLPLYKQAFVFFAMLRICALSVQQWKFYTARKVCFCSSNNSNVGAIFDRILEHWFFIGIVKRCSAKQNGCSGSQGTRDQWSKIVTNCTHPHDVALICDRNHSHASWTTAQHEKYFRTGSKQRRIHEAVVFHTGPFHLQGFSWSGKARARTTTGALEVNFQSWRRTGRQPSLASTAPHLSDWCHSPRRSHHRTHLRREGGKGHRGRRHTCARSPSWCKMFDHARHEDKGAWKICFHWGEERIRFLA